MAGRKREPTRTDHLTAALRASQEATAELKHVDLRTLSGDLRDQVRTAREGSEQTTKALTRALRVDRPELRQAV